MSLPTVPIAGHQITRLICGSNPFLGYSYRSSAHNAWQKRHFTPQRISEVLEACLENGINALLGNIDDDHTLPKALDLVETRVGKRPHWIAYTHWGAEGQEKSINIIADAGAIACYIQGGLVDSHFSFSRWGQVNTSVPHTLDQERKWLQLIRDKGMAPGMGTHDAYVLGVIQREQFDVDFCIKTLNFMNVYCDYASSVMAIRGFKKPVIAIKPLGGNARVKPEEGFTCAFTGVKPTDIVATGMEHEEAAAENARLAERIIAALAV